MALNTQESSTSRNAANDARCAQLNGGFILLYSGTQPPNADSATTAGNVLIGKLAYANPAFQPSAAGTAISNAIGSATPLASGTITWARHVRSDGSTVIDDTAGTTGTNLILNQTTFTIGIGTISASSMSITQPGAQPGGA